MKFLRWNFIHGDPFQPLVQPGLKWLLIWLKLCKIKFIRVLCWLSWWHLFILIKLWSLLIFVCKCQKTKTNKTKKEASCWCSRKNVFVLMRGDRITDLALSACGCVQKSVWTLIMTLFTIFFITVIFYSVLALWRLFEGIFIFMLDPTWDRNAFKRHHYVNWGNLAWNQKLLFIFTYSLQWRHDRLCSSNRCN